MRKRQKIVALIMTMVLLLTLGETVLAVGDEPVANTSDAENTYWINQTFEELETQQLSPNAGPWNLPEPYDFWYNDFAGSDCSIAQDDDAHGNVLKIMGETPVKLYRWTDDNVNPPMSSTSRFVYQFDVKMTDPNTDWWFGFNQEFVISEWEGGNGQIYLGEDYAPNPLCDPDDYVIQPDEWTTLTIEVIPKDTHYEVRVYKDYVYLFSNHVASYTLNDINSFTMTGNASSPICFDNLIAYEGAYPYEMPPLDKWTPWVNHTFDEQQEIPSTEGFWNIFGSERLQNYFYNDSISENIGLKTQKGELLITKKGSSPPGEVFKLLHYTDKYVLPKINHPMVDTITYEMDFCIENFGHNWRFGLNDHTFFEVLAGQNGRIADTDGTILRENRQYHLAIEVQRSTNQYSVFLNAQPIMENVNAPFDFQTVPIETFMIQSDQNTNGQDSILKLDNFTAYPWAYSRTLQPIRDNSFDDLSPQSLPSVAGTWLFSNPAYYNYYYNDKPSDCAIVDDAERGGNVLKLQSSDLKVYLFLASVRTLKFDVKMEDVNKNLWVGFDQTPILELTHQSGGQFLGTEGAKGKISSNEWVQIAMDIYAVSSGYEVDVYINDVLVKQQIPFAAFPSKMTICGDATLPVYVDNLMLYNVYYMQPVQEVQEPPDAIWFSNDFEDAEEQTIAQNLGFWPNEYPYSNFYNDRVSENTQVSISYDAMRCSNVLKLEKFGTAGINESFKVLRYMEDMAAPAPAIKSPSLDAFTYEMDINVSNFKQNWMIGFNDIDFLTMPNNQNGYVGFQSGAQIRENTWHHITIAVNRTLNFYNVYVDGAWAIHNRAFPQGFDKNNMQYLTIKSNYNDTGITSGMSVDNIAAYPREYQGEGYVPPAFAGAQEIEPGSIVNGKIESSGEQNWYWFRAPQSGPYTIEFESVSGITAKLYRESGVIGEAALASGTGTNFEIRTELQEGEIYYLKVNGEIGDYSLYINLYVPPNSATLTCNTGNEYSFIVSAKNINQSAQEFTLTFDPVCLAVADLCVQTYRKELEVGLIKETGIEILEFDTSAGEIVFRMNKMFPEDMSYSGIVNIVKFKALKDSQTVINIS